MFWTMLILFLRTWILLVRMALLHVFEDNEAVVKVIMKGRSLTETCFQKEQSCSWLVIWSNRFGPKSQNQMYYVDTKKQLADMLTKGNVTRDVWNHLRSMIEWETRCLPSKRSTRVSITFLSWTQALHFGRRRESRWNGETCCLPLTRSKATAIHHWRRRNRIRILVGIQIFLELGEWSSAKKTKTIFDECDRRQRKTFCDMENVHVFNSASICIDGEQLLRQFEFPSRIQKISQWNRCSTCLKNWYPNNHTRYMEWRQ